MSRKFILHVQVIQSSGQRNFDRLINLIAAEAASAVREVREGYTKFRETQTYREPILAFYRSLYLFPALLILFGAVWLALYLARRITTPLRLVAEGAQRIASGERGVRVDFPSNSEESRALVASFNRMSERLARSEEEVEFSRGGLVRKNQELEERRRLTETVLETVGTGVVVVDQDGVVTAVNAAAQRLLEHDAGTAGLSLERVLRGPGREEIHALVLRLRTFLTFGTEILQPKINRFVRKKRKVGGHDRCFKARSQKGMKNTVANSAHLSRPAQRRMGGTTT